MRVLVREEPTDRCAKLEAIAKAFDGLFAGVSSALAPFENERLTVNDLILEARDRVQDLAFREGCPGAKAMAHVYRPELYRALTR